MSRGWTSIGNLLALFRPARVGPARRCGEICRRCGPGSSGCQYRGAVAHITGHVRIAAPVGQVFDTVADSRNEPSFNPAMTGIQLLTPPPVGLGTQFRARMGRRAWRCLSS